MALPNNSCTEKWIASLAQAVQRNCDIADACYAGNDSLCIYLLKMRDFYRWQASLPLNLAVDRAALGDWISAKEMSWDELEDEAFEPLTISGRAFDVFDNDGINRVLNPYGYVYSGGLGLGSRPIFFLGKLTHQDYSGSLKIQVSGEELARCMVAPPGMSLFDTIYIRQDALSRYIGSMVEDWGFKPREGAMSALIDHYRFADDYDHAMQAMVEHELENVILHEIGEQIADEMIGEGWQSMLAALSHPVEEHKARVVRDHLADCSSTLPALLAFDDHASLHFYYANMSPLRQSLFPSFCREYKLCQDKGDFSTMKNVINEARGHWLAVSRSLIAQSKKGTSDSLRDCLERSAF